MYGPPNSIEAHPVGVAQPYELWHYREIKEFGPAEHVPGTLNYKTTIVTRKDVDMKFVDICRCGEFQLKAGPKLTTLRQHRTGPKTLGSMAVQMSSSWKQSCGCAILTQRRAGALHQLRRTMPGWRN